MGQPHPVRRRCRFRSPLLVCSSRLRVPSSPPCLPQKLAKSYLTGAPLTLCIPTFRRFFPTVKTHKCTLRNETGQEVPGTVIVKGGKDEPGALGVPAHGRRTRRRAPGCSARRAVRRAQLVAFAAEEPRPSRLSMHPLQGPSKE